MKKLVLCTFLITLIGVQTAEAQKEEFKENIRKELSFETSNANNLLEVYNLNGSITVEGYDGKTVQLVAAKWIGARNSDDLELGKKEIGVKILQDADKIVVYPDVPNMHYKDGRFTSIDCNNYHELSYYHKLDFTLKVPRNIKLEVGAINDGEVLVTNTRGSFLKANNINGGIELVNVSGRTDVHSINGEVKISYSENPKEDSNYYSLNGDINISYQKGLSAEIGFKSMNGELFTDFDIAKQFTKTSKNNANKNGKFKYEARPVVQIGSGGLSHNFETLNGNVIITKI